MNLFFGVLYMCDKISICGAECDNCGFGQNNGCKGCVNSNGCPFGKKCFVFDYIKIGGKEHFDAFKNQLITEFNELKIAGMPKITELYPIVGAYVNLAYTFPNGKELKLLNDNEIYLCSQVECEFNDGSFVKCFGLVANTDFLLVSDYGENCTDQQLLIFKKR